MISFGDLVAQIRTKSTDAAAEGERAEHRDSGCRTSLLTSAKPNHSCQLLITPINHA